MGEAASALFAFGQQVLQQQPSGEQPTVCFAIVPLLIPAMLIVTFMGLTMIPPGSALAEEQASGTDSSDDTGIKVASWLLTVPYCAGKSAFAIAGSVVGGLGYAFSGGNTQTAQSIWTKTVYGTYILRPAHLRGEEPIHFLGKSDDDQREHMKRVSGASDHAKK